jgi:hypothetical protein
LHTQTTPASSCTTARRQRWQRLLCDKPCMQGCPCGHLECPLPTIRDSAHSVEGLVTQGGLPTLVGARCAVPGVNTHLHTTPPACLLAVACGCPAQLHCCTASHNRPLLPLHHDLFLCCCGGGLVQPVPITPALSLLPTGLAARSASVPSVLPPFRFLQALTPPLADPAAAAPAPPVRH